MYKILIVWATNPELNSVKQIFKNIQFTAKIDFFCSWVGNYKTILNLTKLLSVKNYDFVVNIWICWYKSSKLDYFQVARIYNLQNEKEKIVPVYFKFSTLKSISCSEKVVTKIDQIWEYDFVDMESYWIESVCEEFQIPRIILKIPFDRIWSEKTSKFDLKEISEKFKLIDFEELISEIIQYLDKIHENKVDFEKYFKHFNFTFSEKIIFEKAYYKYETISWKRFEDFFKKNKSLDKKIFLNKLTNFQW